MATPVQTFPGIVIVSSYAAMRHAAVAVLLVTKGTAPSAETAIIASFGSAIGTEGFQYGQAFNRAFDLRTLEDYDPVASPTVEEATAVQGDAAALLRYCGERFKFPPDTSSAGTTP